MKIEKKIEHFALMLSFVTNMLDENDSYERQDAAVDNAFLIVKDVVEQLEELAIEIRSENPPEKEGAGG
jgi:hypothetical protein